MFIQISWSKMTTTNIVAFINLIDEKDKEIYTSFRIGIKELGYWTEVGFDSQNSNHTTRAVFEALKICEIYTICAEYLKDNKWYPIPTIKASTKSNIESNLNSHKVSFYNLISPETTVMSCIKNKIEMPKIEIIGDDNG